MATFTVTYTSDGAGNLVLAPAGGVIKLSAGIDKIEIANNAGSEITIESVPLTTSAFDRPGNLMRFKIPNTASVTHAFRDDLKDAFLDETEALPLLWKAKSASGDTDPTFAPGNSQIVIQK